MSDHKFRVGQVVALESTGAPSASASRNYKILQLLPAAWGGTRYRIKSIAEQDDRIVLEDALSDDTCINSSAWDNPAARTPPPDAAIDEDGPGIHVRRDADDRWRIASGGDRPMLGSYRTRASAEAFARALAYSRHVELIVHDMGGTRHYARPALTYPTSLD